MGKLSLTLGEKLRTYCFILAKVRGFKVTALDGDAVTLEWMHIQFAPSDLIEYTYIIYYTRAGTSHEVSISIPSNLYTTVRSGLKNGDIYRFAIAVSKQVGIEMVVGERSSTQTVKIGSTPASSGKYFIPWMYFLLNHACPACICEIQHPIIR